MRWGCCGDGDRLQSIAEAGYDYIESPVRTLCVDEPEEAVQPFFTSVRETGLSVEAYNVFLPGTLPIIGSEVDEAALLKHVRTIVTRIENTGASVIVLGSGGARAIPDGWNPKTAHDQFIAFCNLAADVVSGTGLTIVIEPLAATACNYIHKVEEGLSLSAEVGRSEVGALADLYHMHMNGDPIDALSKVASKLAHVHLPVPTLPGIIDSELVFDHPGYLAALKAGGYEGRISVEDNGKRFTDFNSEAKPVLDYLKTTWDAI